MGLTENLGKLINEVAPLLTFAERAVVKNANAVVVRNRPSSAAEKWANEFEDHILKKHVKLEAHYITPKK